MSFTKSKFALKLLLGTQGPQDMWGGRAQVLPAYRGEWAMEDDKGEKVGR